MPEQKMNDSLNELTKSLAQSVTRCVTLKKFATGLAGIALACFGLASKANAAKKLLPPGSRCKGYAQIIARWCHEIWGVCADPLACYF
jgi:hypothetical protein